jgi:DNA-binding PadR family transcriptional regulator
LRYYALRSTLLGMTSDEQSSAARSNDPTLLILTSLAEGEKHGYALLLDIEQFAGVRLGPGTLYGAISRLVQRGLIEPAAPSGRRRPYRLTTEGAAELQAVLHGMRAVVETATARLAVAPGRPAATGATA